ncbi:MAG: hypothetical protein JRG79_02785 [Deltaproteobacteria bacterium]|nr:hypothetical protein [Deltaproteobacteria bacterium]
MLDQRDKWIRMRFGNIDSAILGRVEEVVPVTWPDLEQSYAVKGNKLTYKIVPPTEPYAERIADIFAQGAYEMIRNSDLEWHHHPDEIMEKVGAGDWNFYGCWLEGELIAAESLYINRGDRIMEWVWGCVDPVYRGRGVWQKIGLYTDQVVALSGAQVGSVWVVTTHKYSQMAVELAGYAPMGCFIGKRFYGGEDGLYYRHTLLHYAKLYNPGQKHLQNWDSMHLTERAKKMVAMVRGFWEEQAP